MKAKEQVNNGNWCNNLWTELDTKLGETGVAGIIFSHPGYCGKHKFRQYDPFPVNSSKSTHFEVLMYPEEDEVVVAFHNEGSTPKSIREPLHKELKLAVEGVDEISFKGYNLYMKGISIKGKKADEVYDEVCEKMTFLRNLIVPIRDKYVKK